MKWSLCLLAVVAGHDEILRRNGDYFLRLGSEGGKLVLDEGDIVEEPVQYRYLLF